MTFQLEKRLFDLAIAVPSVFFFTHFGSRPQLNIKAESFNPGTIVPTYGAGVVNTFDPQITQIDAD